MLVDPPGQGEQLSPLENVLRGQVEQLFLLGAGTEPPGQTEQDLDPWLEIVPAGQSEHMLLFDHEPEGHCWQRPLE